MSDRSPSLQAYLWDNLENDGDRRALAFYDKGRKADWSTYRDLMAGAAGSATILAEAGVRKGDTCVLVAANDRVTVDALLGVLMLGGIPLLLAPPSIQGLNSSLPEILEGMITRVAPRIVLCNDRMRDDVEKHQASHPKVRFLVGRDDLPASIGDPSLMVFPDSEDVAAMQLTSGTTGFPRICVWKQRSVIAAFDGMATAMDVGRDDLFVNWTPLYHDMGLMNNFLMCLTRAIPLVMLSPFDMVKDPSIWMHAISDTGATTSWSPNFGYAIAAQRFDERKLQNVRLDHVRGFWNAAEKIHLDTMEKFAEQFEPYGLDRAALKTNFGCAENVGGATFTRRGENFRSERVDAQAFHEQQIAEPASGDAPFLTFVGCGAPHDGITVYILDEEGKPLPDGHVGELALNTTSRMVGFLGDPESTDQAIQGDLLKTGDMGYVRDGEFYWTGRLRERITVRGRKLDPSDFEAVMLGVSGLRKGAFVAFGVDDAATGTQRVVVVAETSEGDPEVITSAVRHASFDRLGIAIDEVLLVESGTLTKTSSGKRRHRHFKDAYLRGDLEAFRGTRV
jgi:acyl-CoA synthetase (AMP-forming)/AMP-acid ligase II